MSSTMPDSEDLSQKLVVTDGNVYYNCITSSCKLHNNFDWELLTTPRVIVSEELSMMPRKRIENAIRGRTSPFQTVVEKFRKEEKNPNFYLSPVAIFVYETIIRMEVARANCYCRHAFYVQKQNFYEVIRDAKVETLDVHVDKGAHDLFEFVAFTLPGSWCRELQALNISLEDKSCMASFATLLKKSRNMSRLRVANMTNSQFRISDFVRNMDFLEVLELNCPDNTDSGFLLDEMFLKWLVEQQTRTGALKPFRMLKAFNTHLQVSPAEFMKQCHRLACLPHNQKYSEYLSLNEVRGRDQVDFEDPKHCINFEITPRFPLDVCNEMFSAMDSESKSYLQYITDLEPTRRYFLMGGSLFRLIDGNV